MRATFFPSTSVPNPILARSRSYSDCCLPHGNMLTSAALPMCFAIGVKCGISKLIVVRMGCVCFC